MHGHYDSLDFNHHQFRILKRNFNNKKIKLKDPFNIKQQGNANL